jgi:crossover junction endodeoxyribonuclease RuvC
LKILGIDPGLNVTGYGLIQIAEAPVPQLFVYGCVRTKTRQSLAERLFKIHSEIKELISEQAPDVLVMEDIFYAKNIKTAITMGHVRGAVMVAAMDKGVPVVEYSPREIKLSVTGNGGASKEQVNFMVQRILKIAEPITPADASDALAAAICHWHRTRFQ